MLLPEATSSATTSSGSSSSGSNRIPRTRSTGSAYLLSWHHSPGETRKCGKSQLGPKHLFEPSLGSFVIALTTLRFTSTSTSTFGPLSALLKSILLYCYYIIAFISLMMLIIYINQVLTLEEPDTNLALGRPEQKMVTQNIRPRIKRSIPRASPLALLADVKSARQDKTSTRIELRIKAFFRPNNTTSLPIKRSDLITIDQRPKSTPARRTQTKQTNSRASLEPAELTFRQMASYSLNNRGPVENNSTSRLRNSTSASGKPLLVAASSSRIHHAQALPAQFYSPPSERAKVLQVQNLPPMTSDSTMDMIESTYHVEGERRRNRHRHHQGSRHLLDPYHRHQWRRPRLQIGLDIGKIYTRVLVCDKTLVSLDYIKNIQLGPQPADNIENNELDDNIIELGSSSNPVYDESAPDNRQGDIWNKSRSTLISAESRMEHVELARHYSHLPDEDPLIRCDMWDLEKGLKNRKPPREMLQMAVKTDFETVREAINRCRVLSEQTLPSEEEYRDGTEFLTTEDMISLFSMKRGLIPGTKWCGLGDQADSYNDLGPKTRIDICCRAHDHCPIRLKPFRNDYGVLNIALYTKSHCDCDADFYRCLREVHSRTADMLGNLYFNVMKLQCMREEKMKICREMKPLALGFERCIKYEDSPVKTVFKFTTPPVAY